MQCKCGSYAINHHCHGRDGSDDDLCDVCYWRKRAEQPAQQEPIDQLIHAWQAIEETSGHVLDEGDVECRMLMSVIRSAWEQMDSLVREIWDERGCK